MPRLPRVLLPHSYCHETIKFSLLLSLQKTIWGSASQKYNEAKKMKYALRSSYQ